MRRLLPVLLVALVLLGVSTLAVQSEPAAQGVAPLQVLDTNPLSGEELGLTDPIAFMFDRPLNCDTAQAAITIAPRTSMTIACEGNKLTLTNQGGEFARATEYTITLGSALQGVDGGTLIEPFTLKLTTVGFLTVSDVLPSDGASGVEADAVVTVIFNRPVVPLMSAEDMANLPSPLTITPAVNGHGEWLNTSIYIFRPDPAFAGGRQYTVTVSAGLQATDGSVLSEPYSWSFSTVEPSIIDIYPMDMATSIRLDEDVQVTFNQPMDRASVEAAFRLYVEGGAGAPVTGTYQWRDGDTAFKFMPDANLQLGAAYIIDLQSGDQPALSAGGAPLIGQKEFGFYTVPYPAIRRTSPEDGATGVEDYYGFTIYFASPMDIESLEDKITIDPEPWREPDTYYSDYDDSYNLSFPVEPSTTYTITIAPGMMDEYGNTIDEGMTVSYTTASYPPDILLDVAGGGVGFYNAYNEATQLFLKHRNVDRVDLALYHVSARKFGFLLTGDYYYDPAQDYSPASDEFVKQWSIDTSQTPLNAYRYELLDLGSAPGSIAAVDCPDAPPTRLKVGDMAIVIASDAVRARAEPPDGEITTLVYRDYRMPIVGGPVCANGYLWWQVELRDGKPAWVAEGDAQEYYLDVATAAETTAVTVTDAEGGALAPGVYFLKVDSPDLLDNYYYLPRHFLIVGTANLVMKSSIDSVVVWATDVNTGLPIANAPISIYEDRVDPIASGTTDENGLLRLEVPRADDLYIPRLAILQTDSHFGMTSTTMSEGIEPYSFGVNTSYRPDQYRAYLYTDRPIYRPNQPVYFRGVIRLKDDVTYTPPDFNTIPVKIYDENNEVVYEKTLNLTPYGTFSDQFDIAADAKLGYYRIVAQLPDMDDYGYYYGDSGSVGFTVAEYRVPEFQVTVTADEPQVVQGDTINVLVDSRYFFGGAVSNANVEYSVVASEYYFNYQGAGYYSFIDYDYDSGPSEYYYGGRQEIASGEGATDASGQYIIALPADLKDSTQSVTYTIEAVVSDESGQAVAGRTDVIVHKGLIYVGVRPENYVATVGEDTVVNFIAVDWDSQPVAGQSIDVEVVERRWSSVQEEDEAGRTTWTWEVEEIPVTSGAVTTDDDGKASFTFNPPTGGVFKIKATSRDSAGNEVRSAQTLWVSGREYVSWRQQNSNRIDLITDKTDYQVGDIAEILIASPFQGSAEALITVERGDVLHVERMTLTTNSAIYTLPITADFAPNVYVSVLIVKGVDENNKVAAFRMGVAALKVSTEQKVITLDITPDREQAGPRETVTYTVKAADYQGAPVQAEVGVGLTDLATLSIGDPNSGPLLDFYYGEQGLGIRTATPLTINIDQITQEVLDTVKGGGGGFGEGGIFDIRQEFVDTPYWNATLTTNSEGVAQFSVTLPDNLTTWRLDARAVTSGVDGLTLVGQTTYDLLSTKPLLIRPVAPRFFVVGDQVTLAAIVNNNTNSELSTQVALQAAGVTMHSDAAQTVMIPAGSRQRVEWNVTVEDVQNVDLTFFANGGDGAYTDASKPPLGQGDDRLIPVYRYSVPETVGTGGTLRDADSRLELIALPERYDDSQGTLTVKLEQSLAATTLDGLEYLKNYPHQCIEQTVSRFLPNIMTYRAFQQFNLNDPDLEAGLTTAVNFALQRLYAQQKVDGGWGWFVNDESNPQTTAYALIGLIEAKNQGFTVSDRVIERAQNYLRTTYIVPDLNKPEWMLNRQAFILYAMARSGAPDVARTAALFESRERLSYYSRAFLALTFHLIDPLDKSRSDVLMGDLLSGASVSATGIHWSENMRDYWNWNTDTRTTAIALSALVALKPDSDLIPNVVRYLMVQRSADAWKTTQETAWAVMALSDFMVASGELMPNYTYSASLNGALLDTGTATPASVKDSSVLTVQIADLLRDEANKLLIERSEGAGNLYYTAHLRVYLNVPEVEALNRGIIVERRYTRAGSDEPVTEVHVGETLQVWLTVIVPESRHYVVIEDPIPAGTDAVNPQLATSQQIGTQPGLNLEDPLRYGWGWWYFSNIEFRDEKVVLYSTYLPAGTYEYVYSIRAGLPGVYNVIPATGQEFYFPEVYGRSDGSTFTILPAA